MRLYGIAASPFVARVRMQMLAKSLPIELIAPPGGIGSTQLRALSPMGRVPILEVEGSVIAESGIIAEYLEDVYPQPGLRGRSPLQAARVRLICRVVDLYLVPALQPLRAARASPHSHDLGDARRGLEEALSMVNQLLDGGAFAVADQLSLADCALAPFLLYVNRLAQALPGFTLQRWSKIAACEIRMQQHPAIGAVLADMTQALSQPRPTP